MTWLIAWRAVQGFGAGGLVVTATALIADVIPLRERGKYQGALGAVFGVTTVLGPLLGGLFTDHLSWRWAFYVNLPIGIAVDRRSAAVTMPSIAGRRAARSIDYLGIVFVSLGAAGLTLALSWGGTQYAWDSPTIIGAVRRLRRVAWALFVLVESRAPPTRSCRCGCSARRCSRLRGPRLHRGLRDARRDDLPADVPAVRRGRLGHQLGPADPAAGRSGCWSPPSSPARSSAGPGATSSSRSSARC